MTLRISYCNTCKIEVDSRFPDQVRLHVGHDITDEPRKSDIYDDGICDYCQIQISLHDPTWIKVCLREISKSHKAFVQDTIKTIEKLEEIRFIEKAKDSALGYMQYTDFIYNRKKMEPTSFINTPYGPKPDQLKFALELIKKKWELSGL